MKKSVPVILLFCVIVVVTIFYVFIPEKQTATLDKPLKKELYNTVYDSLDFCDIQPLLFKTCLKCHSEGGFAPFAFRNLEFFRNKKSTVMYVLENGIMPPWKADPEYQEFRHQYYLTDDELSMLYTWVYNNAPDNGTCRFRQPEKNEIYSYLKEGDCQQFTQMYTVPENDDHYSYFQVKNPYDKDVYMSYIDLIPGSNKIVHHMSAFVVTDTAADKLYNSSIDWDKMNEQSKLVSNWTMGSVQYRPQEGQAFFFPKEAYILVQVHFTDGSRGLTDSSYICFKKADYPVTQEIKYYYKDKMEIYFEPNQVKTDSVTVDISEDIRMLAIWPHTHRLAMEVECYAVLPDKTKMPLIKIPRWDYFWQNLYEFPEPKKIPKGSKVHMVVKFDNTSKNEKNPFSPPRRIEHGQSSKDEMLNIAFSYVQENQ